MFLPGINILMQQVHLDKRIEPVFFLSEEMFSNAHLSLESTIMEVSASTVDAMFEVRTLNTMMYRISS